MFAEYDQNGHIVGFYAPEIHTNIPEKTIEITTEQWQDCIDNQGKWMIDIDAKILKLAPIKVLTTEDKLANIRAVRNAKIAETDWLMLPDVPLTAENKAQWQQYRQALRDFTETCDLDNPVWPVKPQYVAS